MFEELIKWDLVEKVGRVLHPNGPYVVRPRGHKIYIPPHSMSIDWDQPWVHVRQDDYRFCKLYNDIFIKCLNMIPQKCIECWKVVFRPQYLADMFHLHHAMKRLVDKHGYACKLGMEMRPWTSGVYGKMGLWGSYFYNNSQEKGLKCWEDVRDEIANDENLKHLLEDVDDEGYPVRLVLKRGCTEFEVGQFGDSKQWQQSDDEKKWERIVWDHFERQNFSHPQSDAVQHHIMVKWFKHAHHAGDPTVKMLNEGKMVWGGTRYYHKEMLEEKKEGENEPEIQRNEGVGND